MKKLFIKKGSVSNRAAILPMSLGLWSEWQHGNEPALYSHLVRAACLFVTGVDNSVEPLDGSRQWLQKFLNLAARFWPGLSVEILMSIGRQKAIVSDQGLSPSVSTEPVA
ncbi:hypothetical protein [uncultured Parasphingorhabdus sp.]|uniref:hypothetical protein n=1 Tax=uncultured Parasphingorhabdus sp. TaxID=2709694 RepID=UPI002AA6F4B3|nr:hypothetical protein [uncultured Parasphingorhabdus sp.]